MTGPPKRNFWFLFGWLHGWSPWERLIVLAFWLAPIITLLVGGLAKSELAAGLFLLAIAVFNVVVYRHGGWRLLGPHFYYDVVRLARRGRSTVLRVVYITGLLLGLGLSYRAVPDAETMRFNRFAEAAEHFAYALFTVQNIAILVLIPAYLGSAIAEERERRTLELLFTTQLSDREIILGKLFSRIIHLVGFVLAGWPVLCLVQFWGGIDMLLIAGNLANTLLLIFSVGSFCLLLSTIMNTVTAAVLTAYALLAPTMFCGVQSLHGFPLVLQDSRSGAGRMITVQDLPILLVLHGIVAIFFLGLAWLLLRGRDYFDVASLPERLPTELAQPAAEAMARLPRPTHNFEPGAADSLAIPYTLPPVTDDALAWKERYVGGPPLIQSPIVLVPAAPFALVGAAVIVFWFACALLDNESQLAQSRLMWERVLRFFYWVFLGCYLLGVCFRAASTVARERQQQTLDPLLLLPIDRREILGAKWRATLRRGWPWLALILGALALGAVLGAFDPMTALLLCLTPWPMIAFFNSFGLLASVVSSSVMRAYLAVAALIIGVLIAASLGFPMLPDVEASRDPPPLRYVNSVAVLTAYSVLAWLCCVAAVWRFEDRGAA